MIDLIYSLFRGIASIIGAEQGLIDMWEAIRDFMELGGDVLVLIGILMVVMWVMIVERLLYFATQHQLLVKNTIDAWNNRAERKSWHAHRICEAMLSEARLSGSRYLGLIKACVALCPLLGLLGTVTGMIEVFEVMALMGTGNARAMAAGVCKATVPTICGMGAALSCLFLSVCVQFKSESEWQVRGAHMSLEH